MLLGLGAWSWLLLGAYAVTLRIVTGAQRLHSWVPDPQGPRHDEPPSADEPETPRARLLAGIAMTAVLILAAGFFLAQSGHAIAEQSGLGESFVGVVLLGFATSLPEVNTVLAAVRRGRYEMAIGDIFGTNLFNVTIIVLVDAMYQGGLVLAEAGRFAAFAALLAATMTLLFVVGIIERKDRTFWRMGADSLIAVATYLAGLVMLYRLK